jgi:CxxC motif-containing protein (DUF1111 family)
MDPHVKITRAVLTLVLLGFIIPLLESSSRAVTLLPARFVAQDPGVRTGSAGAGGPLSGLDASEQLFLGPSQTTFQEVESVQGTIPGTGSGLGPRFNLDSCAGCHAQPAVGGSSPFMNPQVAVAKKEGATNEIPFFITIGGPIREARFKFKPDGTRDGGVHDLFIITGRSDAGGCHLQQPDFRTAAAQQNLIFRIPTPVFGAGLIEAIPDSAILANMAAEQSARAAMGITGHPNRHGPGRIDTTDSPNISGNDGSITRFGWKAQNKSPLMFAGEAYNVEMGVTNELFQTERDETPSCLFNATPEDHTNLDATQLTDVPSDIEKFTLFMRFLAPPTPAPDTPSIVTGRALFSQIGCAMCHTPSLNTGKSTTAALSDKTANLFSDLLLHHMGPGLADNIIQGNAGPDEFRTAPLWGLGKRIFFLHDGRTNDLLQAIQAHASQGDSQFPTSEANNVIAQFNSLPELQKQNVLNFLRGL